MDTKNVLMAGILSTIVLIFWGTFFEAPIVKQETAEQSTTKENSTSTPSLDEEETKKNISRTEAISNTDRIKLENSNIEGSISLEGAVIDDVIFKNYNKTLNSNEKVIFLNPKNSDNGYYIETGWASSGNEKLIYH